MNVALNNVQVSIDETVFGVPVPIEGAWEVPISPHGSIQFQGDLTINETWLQARNQANLHLTGNMETEASYFWITQRITHPLSISQSVMFDY